LRGEDTPHRRVGWYLLSSKYTQVNAQKPLFAYFLLVLNGLGDEEGELTPFIANMQSLCLKTTQIDHKASVLLSLSVSHDLLHEQGQLMQWH
jgi:hypothetical protein